jgi:hypothetical protein
LEDLVDGNNQMEMYLHLLDLTRNSCEKCNFRSLAGIEPAISVQFIFGYLAQIKIISDLRSAGRP